MRPGQNGFLIKAIFAMYSFILYTLIKQNIEGVTLSLYPEFLVSIETGQSLLSYLGMWEAQSPAVC
jgi:hypothetical protein